MTKLSALLPVLCCLVLDVGVATAQARRPGPAKAAVSSTTVPFILREIDGRRPVIAVKVNATPFRMVIHANAGFYMQIHHALAREVGVRDMQHAGAFGIQKKGQVSALGRDEGRVDRLSIGKAVFADVPVSVFETSGEQETGMLGLDWIRANRVIMNYKTNMVQLNPSAAAAGALRQRLLRQGYVAVPMQRNADTKRYHVGVTIGTASKQMDVSTVAMTNLDMEFAREAGVGLGAVRGVYGGPQGATGRVHATETPVTVALGAWRSKPLDSIQVEDVYAYMSKERPAAGAIGGQLGADFLVANAAVIDFGNQILYLHRG